jgi:hypothetical protein
MTISLSVPAALSDLVRYVRDLATGVTRAFHVEHTADNTHDFQTTADTAGAAAGYIVVKVNGVTKKIPYYDES